MGRRRRVVAVVVAAVAVLGVLAAVLALGGGPDARPTDGTVVASRGAGASRGRPPGAAADSAGPRAEKAVPAPASPDAAAPAPPVPPGSPAPPVPTPTGPTPAGRDVIRTAELTVEVPDPAAAARRVRTSATAAGGFVAEEQVDASGSWLVLRVPAAGLDRLLDDLAATGTVLARSGRAEDVTDQVVDLDSRVASQRASVTRVRALLAQASSIGDVVAVESELASREADLESLESRLAALRDQVALATLTVELRGTAAPAPAAPPPGFGTGLGVGWAGLKVVGAALATAAGFVLPFLPVLVVAAGATWLVRRRGSGRARRERGGPGPEGGH